MTDPSQNPFGDSPFGSAPPPVYSMPPAPPPDRRPANLFATLSLVFAFAFAPAGAVLGHLGLAQIRRTGQRGRDRALIGVVFSYAVIVVGVTALVVWVWSDSTPARPAASAPTTTAIIATPPPAIAPTVAPPDLGGLIPSLNEVKVITGDQALTMTGVFHQPTLTAGTLDRPECRGVIGTGVPELYDSKALLGFYLPGYVDTADSSATIRVAPGVAAFSDGATTQMQLKKFLSAWRQCNGASIKYAPPDNQLPFTVSMTGPIDVGNGISTMEISAPGELAVHAVAAKANVLVDLLVSYTGKGVDRARRTVIDVANQILNKIPG